MPCRLVQRKSRERCDFPARLRMNASNRWWEFLCSVLMENVVSTFPDTLERR